MATFTVTNSNFGGLGSLRRALIDANANPGADEVVFTDAARGTVVLNETIRIRDDVTIRGPGADEFILDGNGASRVLVVDDADESTYRDVVIEGITITNGFATDGGPDDYAAETVAGGGIWNTENLTLRNVTVSENTVSSSELDGYGDQLDVYGGGIYNTAFLTLEESTVVANSVSTSENAYGAGIANLGGIVHISDSKVVRNGDFGKIEGGAQYGIDGAAIYSIGELKIAGSYIDENESNRGPGSVVIYGGAISSSGILIIEESSVSNNLLASENVGRGGAIYHIGYLEISDSVLQFNEFSTGPGSGEGAVIFHDPNFDLSKNNDLLPALNFDQLAVGSIIKNSLISSNLSYNWYSGGFIVSNGIDILNSTILDNFSRYDDEFFSVSDGAVAGDIFLLSTLIANNYHSERYNGQTTLAPDIVGDDVTSGGNNLIGAAGSRSQFVDGANSDIVGTLQQPVDPRLGALAQNGGRFATFALLSDSPALDAGANPQGFDFDVRGEGFRRVVNGQADIGAFELQNDPPIARDDSATTTEGEPVTIPVLDNDEDPEGEALTVTSTSPPANGMVVIRQGTEVVYTPNPGFAGEDGFTYEVGDGGETARGDVVVTIDPLVPPQNEVIIFLGTDGDDEVTGGPLGDDLSGGKGKDSLWGRGGGDRLAGQKGADELYGGKGSDKLSGGRGDDELYGGKGSDELSGGKGDDELYGGKGRDTFVYEEGDGTDRIYDFAMRESIRLEGFADLDRKNVLDGLEERRGNSYLDLDGEKGSELILDDFTDLAADHFIL